MEIQQMAEQKINEIISQVYNRLSKRPSIAQGIRDLDSSEDTLLRNLDQDSFLYRILVRVLAIDSYITSIVDQADNLQQLSVTMTILLQSSKKMGQAVKTKNKQKIQEMHEQIWEVACILTQINHNLCPNSPYVKKQNDLIDKKQSSSENQGLITKIQQQNIQLRKKLQLNDEKLITIQNKLNKLLKQQENLNSNEQVSPLTSDPYGNNQSRMNQSRQLLNIAEMREEIAYKQAEIERMNEQFSYEIQKYNTVYDAMKRQLEELKAYQNIDLIEQIQMLETEIVRLREERERDQLIIKQLRSDSMIFSTAGGHMSPRNNNSRFYNSRFNI